MEGWCEGLASEWQEFCWNRLWSGLQWMLFPCGKSVTVNRPLHCLNCNISYFNSLFLNLTGKYLLPNATGQQLWQPVETTNLVRMRYQTFGQSAPSLTASLVSNFFSMLEMYQKKIYLCVSWWEGGDQTKVYFHTNLSSLYCIFEVLNACLHTTLLNMLSAAE